MRPAEDIKRLIRNARIKINSEVKQTALKQILNELEAAGIAGTSAAESKTRCSVTSRRIAKIAIAAALIIAACLLFVQQRRQGQIEVPNVAPIAMSPAQSNTLASLTLAYREGGIEGLEQQCDKTLELLGPFDNSRIARTLPFAQFENSISERTHYEN